MDTPKKRREYEAAGCGMGVAAWSRVRVRLEALGAAVLQPPLQQDIHLSSFYLSKTHLDLHHNKHRQTQKKAKVIVALEMQLVVC